MENVCFVTLYMYVCREKRKRTTWEGLFPQNNAMSPTCPLAHCTRRIVSMGTVWRNRRISLNSWGEQKSSLFQQPTRQYQHLCPLRACTGSLRTMIQHPKQLRMESEWISWSCVWKRVQKCWICETSQFSHSFHSNFSKSGRWPTKLW